MNTQNGDLDTVVQEAMKNDAEFQTALTALTTDEERTKATEEKRKEILAAKAVEFHTIAGDQKRRAEKAEQELKEGKGDKKDDKNNEVTPPLSTTDLYALMNAKIEQEDVEEVQKAAKLLNKSISEALNEPTVIGIIKERVEKRNSARAAEKDKNNGGGNQGQDEASILERSRNGERFAPRSREAEILYRAKRGIPKS